MRAHGEPGGVGGKELHQGVLIQQEFGRVDRPQRARAHAGHGVEQRKVQKRLCVCTAAAGKTAGERAGIVCAGIHEFGVQLHAQQGGREIGLGAVVAPGRGQHQRHARFFAGGQRWDGRSQRFGVIRRRPAPCPDPAREYGGRGQCRVLLQHIGILLLGFVVIVPIHKRHIRLHGGHCFGRGHTAVIIAVGGGIGPEIHIAPHHGRKTVAACDLQHAGKMPADDGVGVLVAVAAQVRAQTDAVGLVHADVDAFGTVGRGGSRDKLLQECVGLRIVGQQNLLVVLQMRQRGPVQRAVQMAQRLDAGTKLDAQHIGIIIQRPQLVCGITPALIAEVGLAGHLIGVLGVHHAQVEPHHGHFAQEKPQRVRLQHRIAGNVEHHARCFKAGRFLNAESVLRPVLAQQ